MRRLTPLRCSFCRRDQSEVEKLVAGPRLLLLGPRVTICESCAAKVRRIMDDPHPATSPASTASRFRRFLASRFRRDSMRKAMLASLTMLLMVGGAPAAAEKSSPVDVGAGRVAWFDLTTTSLPQSAKFYGELFKWDFKSMKETDKAMEIIAGGTSVGTIR